MPIADRGSVQQIVPGMLPARGRGLTADVAVNTGDALRRTLKIRFRRDGSIFVMFTGLENQLGVIAHSAFEPPRVGIRACRLAESGVTTSHLVKYSHHADGRAHFSQDGKVRTVIKKMAAPLGRQGGHLFTLRIAGAKQFKFCTPSSHRRLVTLCEATDLGTFNIICTRHRITDFGTDAASFWQSKVVSLNLCRS